MSKGRARSLAPRHATASLLGVRSGMGGIREPETESLRNRVA